MSSHHGRLMRAGMLWVITVLLVACSSQRNPSEGDGRVGTISMALNAVSGSHAYRLTHATFTVSGPTPATLSSEDQPDAGQLLSGTLKVGSYSVQLESPEASPWSLERLDASSWVPVQAALLSPNPLTGVVVRAGATTTVKFEFVTNGTIVTLGDTGSLAIGIGVSEIDAGGGYFDSAAPTDASFCDMQPCGYGDGCCPSACDANRDGDCLPICGNLVIEAGETCDSNCSCPSAASSCMTPQTGTAGTCDLVCSQPQLACNGGDACCPYGCDKQSDGDCGSPSTGWKSVAIGPANYTTYPACNIVRVFGVARNSQYAITTCYPTDQNPGTGDPIITSIVDDLGHPYLNGSEDDCTAPTAIPYRAGWSCQNTAGSVRMACASQASGGFTTQAGPIFRLDVTICASGAAAVGQATLYVFYNAPTVPNPG